MTRSEIMLSFSGRIDRRTYWIYGVFIPYLVMLLASLLDVALESGETWLTICQLLLIWPLLAVQVKRWHDRDKSAWWILIGLLPFIGAIWAFVELGFFEGTYGDNRYGSNPRAIKTRHSLEA